jgi:hypothetical protein
MTVLWEKAAGLFCFFVLGDLLSWLGRGATVIGFIVCQARVVAGVDIVEVVGLRAELILGVAVAELLDQKIVLRGAAAEDVIVVARDQCTLT